MHQRIVMNVSAILPRSQHTQNRQVTPSIRQPKSMYKDSLPYPYHTPTISPALSTSQGPIHHRLVEDLKREGRLIVRHFVPGPKHSQEAQIVHRLERASLRALYRIRRQCLRSKSRGARVGDGVGGSQVAKPVAYPVRIAGPHDDANSTLNDGGEGREEVAGV